MQEQLPRGLYVTLSTEVSITARRLERQYAADAADAISSQRFKRLKHQNQQGLVFFAEIRQAARSNNLS